MDLLSSLFIVIITVAMSAQNVIKKGYNKKSEGKGVFTFSGVTVLTACIFFVVKSGFYLPFGFEMLPFAIGFAVCYFCASVFNFLAIQAGPLSLTSLAVSYSLIIPTLYGLIFDGDEAGIWLFVGLGLLLVSLVLINAKKGDTKITLKWAVYAVLALVGNGLCSTLQPLQSRIFGGEYDSTFMVVALLSVFLGLAAFAYFHEREEILPSLKCGAHLMVLCGIANGLVNLLVMVVSKTVDNSVMFPIISAGGIVVTWIVSTFFYKEKLTLKQNVGMVLGVLAIVFLNI